MLLFGAKYLEKVILRIISWVLIQKNIKFAYVNNFFENVKNNFELILWLKKGGGLMHEGVLYAGFYGMCVALCVRVG